jgi:hypothetical protein
MIYDLLSRGWASTDFESLKYFFIVFKNQARTQKNGNNSTSWGIVESMNHLILECIQNVIIVANFLYVSAILLFLFTCMLLMVGSDFFFC